MTVASYLMLACASPLLGFVVLVFFGRRMGRGSGVVATGLVMGSLGLSIAGLAGWVAKDAFNQAYYVEATSVRWLAWGSGGGITVGTFVDSLTVAMFVMVSLIASLVHLFSIAWVSGEERKSRYFALLNLFVFGVLAAILSGSLVQVLVFLEVAGVASFLLVGFWFQRRGPAMGALKSIVVNGIGTAAFLLGLGILVANVGVAAVNFGGSQGELVGEKGGEWLTWVGLLLFVGAAVRAGQFPLHVWLPESMESPAPVSALAHGTTLMAVGVYVVARIYPILTDDARLVIAIVGCVTLLMGALLAMVQMKLRRVLAYGAMSQAGYMMLFFGTGGYTAGLVHMFTYSFFGACLFLGAACVIHAVKGEEDFRQMGGLWRRMPLTALGFAVGAMAMIGVPLFSGAYSHGLGMASVYEYARVLASSEQTRLGMFLFYVPAMVSFVTAYYMGRCWWLVFAGRSRDEDLVEEASEPFLMLLPIGMLALLSANFYEFFLLPSLMSKSFPAVMPGGGLQPVPTIWAATETDNVMEWVTHLLMGRAGGYAWWGFLGVIPAIVVYYGGFGVAERLRRLPVVNLVCHWLRERMFLDSLYNVVFVRGVLVVAWAVELMDRYVLETVVDFVGQAVRRTGEAIGKLETRNSKFESNSNV